MHPLEAILRMCAEATPNPWYPSVYAQATGTPREQLDPYLDQLRMGGLIHLTEWVQGTGQGYALTPSGKEVLDNPRYLNRLRAGELSRRFSQGPASSDIRGSRGTAWDRGEAVRDALLGSYTPVVTYGLIAINVLVFLAGYWLASVRQVNLDDYLRGGDNTGEVAKIQELIGALRGGDVYVRGQWWRLLTACFGHIGWMHLASNMVSLYMVGPLLERIWGPGRFFLLYLLAGLGGSCGMLIENPLGGGAGASGAIWGILASLVTWIGLNRRVLPPSLIAHWRRQLLIVFVLNLYITFAFANISKGGHFGGGIVGLLAAVPLDYLRFGSAAQRRLALAALIAIPVVCVAAVLVSFRHTGEKIRYHDEQWSYYVLEHQFVPTYNRAVPFYNDKVLPLLQLQDNGPGLAKRQRLADDLAKHIDDLANHQAELTALADQVEKTGPFHQAEWERKRQDMLTDLKRLINGLEEARKIVQQNRKQNPE
jgi:membrane associated rhomboid family serine protease